MNSKQLQYAIELAEVRNFSKVSEKLNISQPALSKQIGHLEKDLGIKLFDRNYIPLRLTPAGEQFVKDAKELLYKEEQMKRMLSYYRSGERGRLMIGLSPFRSQYLIMNMIKKLHERYPGVEISICDNTSEQIRKDLHDGKLDFAVLNLPVDDSVLDYIPLEPDILVLAVPNEMLDTINKSRADMLAEIDIKECSELPFVVVEPSREMRGLFDCLCNSAGIQPHIAVEVVGLTTAWAMARAGIGAALLPLQFVNGEAFESQTLTLFRIKDNVYQRRPAIITRRDQYLSEYARYAIELLTMREKEE